MMCCVVWASPAPLFSSSSIRFRRSLPFNFLLLLLFNPPNSLFLFHPDDDYQYQHSIPDGSVPAVSTKKQFFVYLESERLNADLSHPLDAFLDAMQLSQVVLCWKFKKKKKKRKSILNELESINILCSIRIDNTKTDTSNKNQIIIIVIIWRPIWDQLEQRGERGEEV